MLLLLLHDNLYTHTYTNVKMVKGAATTAKVHYKGSAEDFLVFVDDIETFKKWKSDKSVPLAHFISSYKVFVTHK